jgi:hypothetical protein
MDSKLSALDLLNLDIDYIANQLTAMTKDDLQKIDKSKISGLIQNMQVLE